MDGLNEMLYLAVLERLKDISRRLFCETKQLSQKACNTENGEERFIIAEIMGINVARDMVHQEIGSLVMWHDLEWNEQS